MKTKQQKTNHKIQDEKKEDENDAVVIDIYQVFSTKKRILVDDEEASRKKVKST